MEARGFAEDGNRKILLKLADEAFASPLACNGTVTGCGRERCCSRSQLADTRDGRHAMAVRYPRRRAVQYQDQQQARKDARVKRPLSEKS